MGRDKAALPIGETRFATHLAGLLGSLFEEVLLVGGAPPDDTPGRAVSDPSGPVCALRGLVAALSATRAERVLVLATDLPLLTADLLLALTAWPEHDAVAPRDEAGTHPLCAVYRRVPVLEIARERLEAGQLQLHALLDVLDTGYLEGADLACVDPDTKALTNINTPEDLIRAETLLA